MDYRSFYLHYENAVWMYDKKIVDEITKDFLDTVKQSREISYEEWKKRSFKIKVWQQILNLFSTLM